jgi:hypothetical protein
MRLNVSESGLLSYRASREKIESILWCRRGDRKGRESAAMPTTSKLSQFAPWVFLARRIAPCSRTVFRKSMASALILIKKVTLKPTADVTGLVGLAGLITSKFPTSLTAGKPVFRISNPKLSPIWSC